MHHPCIGIEQAGNTDAYPVNALAQALSFLQKNFYQACHTFKRLPGGLFRQGIDFVAAQHLALQIYQCGTHGGTA